MNVQCPFCSGSVQVPRFATSTLYCSACRREFDLPPTGVIGVGQLPAAADRTSAQLANDADAEDDDREIYRLQVKRRHVVFESATRKVAAAANGLIAAGILGMLFSPAGIAVSAAMSPPSGIRPSEEAQAVTVVAVLLNVAMSLVVVFGAIRLKRLRNRGLAKTAAVIALIPLASPCLLLGLPFGFWAMYAMGDPEVEEAFRNREQDRL